MQSPNEEMIKAIEAREGTLEATFDSMIRNLPTLVKKREVKGT